MKYNSEDGLSLSSQLCFPLYSAARNVTNLYSVWLKPYGLTYTQYIVFLALWEKDGISIGELCEKLMLDNGTLSPLLKRLQQAGYLERTRSRQDDRVVLVTLTDKGKALRDQVHDIPAQIAQYVDMAPERVALLYDLLYELIEKQEKSKKNATQPTPPNI